MIKADDVSKVNRIFERFDLSSVDMASIKSDLEKIKEKAAGERTQNPTGARTMKDSQSGLSLNMRDEEGSIVSEGRRSVRDELRELIGFIKGQDASEFPERKDSSGVSLRNCRI